MRESTNVTVRESFRGGAGFGWPGDPSAASYSLSANRYARVAA